MTKITLEVCVDSIQSVINASEGGADRIELCSALSEGGLTPSEALLVLAKRHVQKIPIFVMIRPRAGDFVYSQNELDQMKMEIDMLKRSGADGFVFGCLDEDGHVDLGSNQELLTLAGSLPCTFHRAFDLVADPQQALQNVIKLGFKRVLTSGQSETALAGLDPIRQLVSIASNRISIMAGAGVTPQNVLEIIQETGVKEVHASAKKQVKSKMKTTTSNVTMGSSDDDSWHYETDSGIVRKLVDVIKQLKSS